jgi:hypothetical protein
MRLLPRSPSEATDPFDPECFDFVAYVARCHGLKRDDTASIARRWLASYEPSAAARRAFGSEASRSGIRHAIPCQDLERTGTHD